MFISLGVVSTCYTQYILQVNRVKHITMKLTKFITYIKTVSISYTIYNIQFLSISYLDIQMRPYLIKMC